MREHGFLAPIRRLVTVGEVSRARGLPSLVTASPGDSLMEVVGRMRQHAVSQIPVVDDAGRLVGLVTELLLLDHMLTADPDRLPAMSIGPMVVREVATAAEGEPLDEVLPKLVTSKVVILVDPAGSPTGILTVIDALDYMASRDSG
jgi:cystathionine beta-synthase